MSGLTRSRRLALRGLTFPPLEDLGLRRAVRLLRHAGLDPRHRAGAGTGDDGHALRPASPPSAALPPRLSRMGSSSFCCSAVRGSSWAAIAAVPWIALLAALAIASSVWSLDPLLTLRRSIPFALAGLFGVYFASRFSRQRQMAILRLTLVALALATVGVVLLVPAIGLDHSPGHAADWQGVFTQKNACGRIMVLATAVVLFSEHPILSRLASLTLFVFVLIMSGSRGAWIIEAALLLLWLVVRLARRSSPRVRTLMAVAGTGRSSEPGRPDSA